MIVRCKPGGIELGLHKGIGEDGEMKRIDEGNEAELVTVVSEVIAR